MELRDDSPAAHLDASVAIVGAGPAGIACALELARQGVRDVLLVDRQEFPRDKTCGSGVSPKGIETLKRLGAWEAIEPHVYPISGLRLVTPGDREMDLSGGEKAAAIVCCRRTLDHLLLQAAVREGVRFEPRFLVTNLDHDATGRVTGFRSLDGRQVRARFTVVADGAHSRFSPEQRPKRTIQAIMGWWENVRFQPNCVEMVFDRMVLPYYGWLFPEGPGRVNIGICYEDLGHKKNARRLFTSFLEKHYGRRLQGAIQVGDFKGHPISYCYSIGRLHSPGRMVIGEAGRMTHPATAEGIYQGMWSGIVAADALRRALAGDAAEEDAMADYESQCRRQFQLSFRAALLWRLAVRTPLLDWFAQAMRTRRGKNMLARLMAEM